MSFLKNLFLNLLYILNFDKLCDKVDMLHLKIRLLRYEKMGKKITFHGQGGYQLEIAGDISKFEIHGTSHLKSNTFIEASGGVKIGKYFHVGRGLTIFSTNHNWQSTKKIPYDEVDLMRPVTIGDAVWFGSNVTVAPGSTIGKGVVAASGTVIFGNIPDYAIIRGNPAEIIKYRDKDVFEKLYQENCFF